MYEDKKIIDLISCSLNLIVRELLNYELEDADYILKISTKETLLLDFSKIDYLYNEDYIQAKLFLEKNKNNIKINII